MRRPLLWAARGLPLTFLVLQACITDDTPNGDAGIDAGGTSGGTTGGHTTGSTTGNPIPDAQAEADADAAEAAADASPEADAKVDAVADAAPVLPELVSPAQAPFGLTLSSTTMYWTEATFLGAAVPVVRSCALTGCATLPAAIYTGTAGNALPMGIAVASPAGSDVLFYADNQVPNNTLWKMDANGANRTQWGSNPVAGAGVVTDGTTVFWGNGQGLYRTPVASKTEVIVQNGNLAGNVENNPHSVAVDGTNVYSVLGGNGVSACAKGSVCVAGDGGSTATLIANETNARGVVSDGTNVYFTAGMTSFTPGGKERVLRCPIAGCAGGNGFLLAETSPAANGSGTHFGIVVDAANVYWGTIEGTIYRCPKNSGTQCTPTPMATGTKPYGFAQDATHLYWADLRGGIYRLQKP